MFLDSTIKRNPRLIEAAFELHRTGELLPDCYLLDYDTIMENGGAIANRCRELGLHAYFMTKQLGRNPVIAAGLMERGFEGAVTVDFSEALVMLRNKIPIGHAGHLVQPPKALLKSLVGAVDYFTVYTVEKARELGEAASALGSVQKLILRVRGEDGEFYDGQQGGFNLAELERVAGEIAGIKGVLLAGVTSFPTLLYDEQRNEILATPNFAAATEAARRLTAMGFDITQVNTPSANCLASLELTARLGGTHVEPGHALTGTTPFGAHNSTGEKPAIVYLSEVSHNYEGFGYCYGGGHYRRGHMQNALVGGSLTYGRRVGAAAPSDESIDYHFRLSEPCTVSDGVVMAFRTQIFTTRSRVAVIKGLAAGKPLVDGVYDSQGRLLDGGLV